MYNSGTRSYRRTSVMTADPMRLVIMCYEGAIESLKKVKQKMAEGDYEGKCEDLVKAQNIIVELLSSLEPEKGGSIAKNLDSLYNYMLRKMFAADVNKDMGAIDEIVGMLGELKSAWEEISHTCKSEPISERVGFTEEGRLFSGSLSG